LGEGKDKAMSETIYGVKYALTKGILPLHHAVYDEKTESVTGYFSGSKVRETFYRNQFAKTMPEAYTLAEKLRVRKIASLKKKIAKLEKMAWDAACTEIERFSKITPESFTDDDLKAIIIAAGAFVSHPD